MEKQAKAVSFETEEYPKLRHEGEKPLSRTKELLARHRMPYDSSYYETMPFPFNQRFNYWQGWLHASICAFLLYVFKLGDVLFVLLAVAIYTQWRIREAAEKTGQQVFIP